MPSFHRRIFTWAFAILVVGSLSACAKKHSPASTDPAPHTGDPTIEADHAKDPVLPLPVVEPAAPAVPKQDVAPEDNKEKGQTAPLKTPKTKTPSTAKDKRIQPIRENRPATLRTGTIAYIWDERLRVRATPEVTDGNIIGVLDMNDEVEILDATPIGNERFVQIRINKSDSVEAGQSGYVAAKYLNRSPRKLTQNEAAPLKYFVVQNIATERLRVYRRCQPSEGCTNRMVFETEIIAGEDESGTRTNVGYYKIDKWVKFYEDAGGRYPAWYNPNYPALPPPHSDKLDWLSSSVMPNGNGEARGAFGWYTALVGPNANSQWTHGTYGWGADKDDFITFRHGFWAKVANIFASIRSHGCTRVDNPAIAYLRHILPVGTTMVKIYAKEAYRDPNRSEYANQTGKPSWAYILTTDGYGKAGGLDADRDAVIAAGVPEDRWIELGYYDIDQYPDAVEGDLYDIGDSQFQGLFAVDEGTLYQYAHPYSLGRGGFADQTAPSFMQYR